MDMRSEQLNELTAALVKAQFEIDSAHKNKAGYNYKYADIECVIDACREQLAKHGLVITHQINRQDKCLVSCLLHVSGQWMSSEADLHYEASGKININQAMGASITYARRYNIQCLANIAVSDIKKEEVKHMDEDDDGVSASPSLEDKKIQTPKEPPPSVKNKPEDCITKEQRIEFEKVWKLCSEDHKKTYTKILKNPPNNANCLAEMPKNVYAQFLELARLNAQLNAKNKEGEDVSENSHA
jgi:hypothetical protein